MNWHTVYDIGSAGNGDFTHFLLAGGAFLVLALVFHLVARRRGQRSTTAKILLAFGLIVGGLGYGVNTWDHNRLAGKLAAVEVLQVEGPVSEHQRWRQDITRPRDSSRKYQNWETMIVGGVRFTWAPGADEPAFTNAQEPPLAIADGLPLRVSYVEDIADQAHQRRIVRLEVGDAPAHPVSRDGDFAADPPPAGAPFPSTASPR
jgi:hypothetical protein